MATLIVALVLLGIVSVMTLFSLSYGMQQRRTAGDEMAARLVREAAQAALDQGLLFFRARSNEALSTWLSGPGRLWQRCAPQEQSVPCGAVDAAVRANYLHLATPLDMSEVFSNAAGAPTQQVIAKIGEFEVRYEVYALLCLVDTGQPQRQCLPENEVTADSGDRKPYAITLIARAQLPTDDGGGKSVIRQAVLKQTIAMTAGNQALAVVPGSWSDAGRIDAVGDYKVR